MDLTPFTTSPCTARHDGWSSALKVRFLDHLAARGVVAAACAAVGLSREAAYRLRRRDALFARGWAAALRLAREASAEGLADKALDGIEEEVWYRGERVGTRRRFDARLLLAHLARLDRMVEEEAGKHGADDAARFEEILACVAGAEIPEAIEVTGQPLPLDREAALAMAGDMAVEAVDEAWTKREAKADDESPGDEAYAAYEEERRTAASDARAEAAAQWDAWHENAYAAVDAMLGKEGAVPVAGTLSGSSTSAVAIAVGPDGRRYACA